MGSVEDAAVDSIGPFRRIDALPAREDGSLEL